MPMSTKVSSFYSSGHRPGRGRGLLQDQSHHTRRRNSNLYLSIYFLSYSNFGGFHREPWSKVALSSSKLWLKSVSLDHVVKNIALQSIKSRLQQHSSLFRVYAVDYMYFDEKLVVIIVYFKY
mmetsp:Transcript_8618/g.18614  ORF Transcript_8618/g.18614 Transcript_8618/m.18614 type:complete len:122 (+) Transcript_8618:896-1261(+)